MVKIPLGAQSAVLSSTLALLVIITCPTIEASHVSAVDVTISPIETGMRYEYSISNIGADNIAAFTIALDSAILVETAMAPTGWESLFAPGFVNWLPSERAFEIGPGMRLEGFSVTSSLRPGTIVFFTLGSAPASGELTDFHSGETVGPSAAIPEPSTLALTLLGFALLSGYIFRPRSDSIGIQTSAILEAVTSSDFAPPVRSRTCVSGW